MSPINRRRWLKQGTVLMASFAGSASLKGQAPSWCTTAPPYSLSVCGGTPRIFETQAALKAYVDAIVEPIGGEDPPPAPTWDVFFCHRYSLDESPGNAAPQYLDSVGLRNLTVLGAGATTDGRGFNGHGTAYALSPVSGFVTPLNVAGLPFTNTGICHVSDGDCLAVANFDDGAIHEFDKAGVEIRRFPLSSGPAFVQGIAWNTLSQCYAVVGASDSPIHLYNRDGAFLGTVPGQPNSIAYDAAANGYWLRVSAGNLKLVDPWTGATQRTLTLSGAATGAVIEGVSCCAIRGTLYITADVGNRIYEVDALSGATIQNVRGPHDIEHAAYDPVSDCLWVNGDARYHSSAQGGENVVYRLRPNGQPWVWSSPTDAYSLEWWWKPDNLVTTADVLSMFSAVKAGAFYIEVQVRSTGKLRVYDSNVTYMETPASTFTLGEWQYCRLTYNPATTTLSLYRNNVLVAQKTNAAFNCGPDGRLAIGARPNGTFKHQGTIDEVRLHSSARTQAYWDARWAEVNG